MTGPTPEEYDRWYQTPRGRWIGQLEYGLVRSLLKPRPEESLLDVGCGTGYFTRCLARDQAAAVVGVDPDPAVIEYARLHAANRERYIVAPGEALPFSSRAFDLSVSITAMCFVQDQVKFLREMARVTHRCFAVGLLHRHSLLWRCEGRGGGQGGYRGAHWHTKQEVVGIFAAAGLFPIFMRTALHFPSGNSVARMFERILPIWWPWGGFIIVICNVAGQEKDTDDYAGPCSRDVTR
jgi:SAM-dependent methyltransferase